ncbi:RNA polymerase sigma factor [Cellulomonas sp. NS3]|uniref:RNA polymerase sigma factor n=1 Tax=Cellulomonas sp. NS3 TaxID=2973977 RepID=UPI002162B94E|nr:sigma-70 family RNA polymerase sigma factor [Cellulomonas sp. NS3]
MAGGARDQVLVNLVRARGEALTRYAYVYTGDMAAAQDLVQDALVKVFVRSRTRSEPEALEAYVRRVIATTYIDGYRRRRTWDGLRHLLARRDDDQAVDPTVTASDRLDLRAALAALGRQERTAVVLRFYDDLTVLQVAEVMQVAEGTVKRYLSNALHRLEARLGTLDPLDGDERSLLVAREPRRTAAPVHDPRRTSRS